MLPDFDEQIRNVLSGRSAFGAPGFGQMPVSCGPQQMAIVRHYVTRFCAECTARDDRTRTVLIRKLVGYVVRTGCLGDNDMRLASAVMWFAAHPADVCSPMGITGAARRRQQQLQLARATHKRFAHDHVRSAMAVPEAPCPVLLADRDYSLLQLVHPMHLLRAGRGARNCLAVHLGDSELPNPHYWMKIVDEEARLYAISKGPALCAIFLVKDGALREWEYVHTPADLLPFVRKSHAALETMLGPVRDELSFIIIDGDIVPVDRWPPLSGGGPRG
jgi:hypothetical protein